MAGSGRDHSSFEVFKSSDGWSKCHYLALSAPHYLLQSGSWGCWWKYACHFSSPSRLARSPWVPPTYWTELSYSAFLSRRKFHRHAPSFRGSSVDLWSWSIAMGQPRMAYAACERTQSRAVPLRSIKLQSGSMDSSSRGSKKFSPGVMLQLLNRLRALRYQMVRFASVSETAIRTRLAISACGTGRSQVRCQWFWWTFAFVLWPCLQKMVFAVLHSIN